MSRNSAVDIAKYVAAIFVVAIHTHPFQDIGELADFISVGIMCRWAVPFFAICTGFYLTLATANKDIGSTMKKTFYKILKMYVGWSFIFLMIYFVDWYKEGTLCREYIVGWLMSLFVSETYYHLWYLSALLYALPLFALLLRYIPLRHFYIVALCLWTIQVISYAYANNLPEVVRDIMFTNTKLPALHSGVTRILPLLMMGAWISKFDLNKFGFLKSSVLFLAFFLLMIMEIMYIRSVGGERWSFIFTTLPMAAVLFCAIFAIGGKMKSSYLFAKISMIVYCIHPAVIWLLKDLVSSHLLLFIMVAIISTFLSLIWLWIHNIRIE